MTETEKLLLRDIYVNKMPYCVALKQKLRSLAVRGKYNLFLFMHLGDDFIRLSVKKHFEKQYGKMHFIIQPNEIFLMELFGIEKEDYTVFDYKPFLSKLMPKESEDAVIREYTYFKIIENTVLPVPNTYEPFICWSNNLCSCKEYEEKYGKIVDLFSFVKGCLGIITNKQINFEKTQFPAMSKILQERLSVLGTSAEKVVLFLPEARSDEMIDKRIWESLAKRIHSMGYTIIENVIDDENHIEGCLNPKFSLLELSAIAVKCRSIFSLRSGMCDIFASLGEKLYVFWTPERLSGCGEVFSFVRLYDLKKGHFPTEILLQKKQKAEICFDGENIGSCLPDSLFPARTGKRGWIKILIDLAKEAGIIYSLKIARRKTKQKIAIKMKNMLHRHLGMMGGG